MEKQEKTGEECFWIALENVLASQKSKCNSCPPFLDDKRGLHKHFTKIAEKKILTEMAA